MSMLRTFLLRALPIFTFATPLAADALGAVKVAGVFNIFVGFMLTAAILVYGIGFVVWVTRLHTWPTYRDDGVKILEWAVIILFILLVIMILVRFFQQNTALAMSILATIVLAVILWLVIKSLAAPKEKKEEH